MKKTEQQPNILMIMADQLAPQFTEPYGHPVVKTPNMQEIADKGITFDNAYCNHPICAASRSSMMAGRYPYQVGIYDNATELSAQVPSFAHLLNRAGYHTCLSGKMHFVGPDQLHGFQERLTTDVYPSSFRWTHQWENEVVSSGGTNVSVLPDSGPCEWNLQMEHDEEVHTRGLSYLRKQALQQQNDDRAQPFFMCASYIQPHDPFICGRKWWDLYEVVDIDPPRVKEDKELTQFHEWLQTFHGVYNYPYTEDDMMRARRGYYGMISDFDDKVGQWVSELKRLGLYENTVLMVISDHGEMMGEHGMWFKRSYYEHSVRVPILMSWEKKWPQGKRTNAPVTLVDMFPTLCDIAGVPSEQLEPLQLNGKSVVPIIEGKEDGQDRHALVEYTGEGVQKPMRMVRKDQWKYIKVKDHPPVLFDLEQDPDETENVFEQYKGSEMNVELDRLITEDWDEEQIERDVIRSQKQRKLLNEAYEQGNTPDWDYRSQPDEPRKYVARNTQQEVIVSLIDVKYKKG